MTTVVKGKILRQDQHVWDGATKTAARKDATGGTITGTVIGHEVDVLMAYGNGDSYTWQTIRDATRSIGSASVTLVFNPGTWTIDQDLTIASNFTCRIPAGCVFDVSSGKTLTFSGPVIRDSNTWASGSGTVTEAGTRTLSGLLDLSSAVLQGGTPLVFEGATANAFETSLQITDPTADRTVLVPDTSIELCTPRGHISGLTLSNNATDATNDIDIAVGQAVDTTGVYVLNLTSAITKRLDATWAVGTNQGGLDTGAIANDVYHVWLIRRSDTGVVDSLFSASATSPTMPTSYDQRRRIGAIIRSAGAILGFTQIGDTFLLDTVTLDIDAANPGVSAVTRTLNVPDGVKVIWIGHAHVFDDTSTGAGSGIISSLDQNDTAPVAGGLGQLQTPAAAGADAFSATQMQILTNTSAQVRSRLSQSDADIHLRMTTEGWIDFRGKYD